MFRSTVNELQGKEIYVIRGFKAGFQARWETKSGDKKVNLGASEVDQECVKVLTFNLT